MAEWTLDGDLGNIIGEGLTGPNGTTAKAYLVPLNPPFVVSGEVRFGSLQLDLDSDYTFDQDGIAEGGYRVEVRYVDYFKRDGYSTWRSPDFLLDEDKSLGDIVDDHTTQFQPDRPEINLGSVSGTVDLSYLWGRQEASLSGNVTLTLPAGGGPEIACRITLNEHTVSLSGASWHGGEAPDYADTEVAVVTFVHWPSGWYAFPVGAGVAGDGGEPEPEPGDEIVNDTFTASTGNITAHTPDTSPAAAAWRAGPSWQEPTAGPTEGWGITGNKLTANSGNASGTTYYNSLPIGSADRAGITAGIDYVLVVQGDTSEPEITLAIGSHLILKLTKSGGTCSLSADNGGGHGAVSLTGTTTGIAATGRLGFSMVGTALSVLIDDDEVATGTMFASHDDDTFVGIYIKNLSASTLDNYTVTAL